MVQRSVPAWEQLLLTQLLDGTVLHAPFDDIGSILSAVPFCVPAANDTPPVHSLRYFSGAVQDRADGSDGLFRHHHLCTLMRMEIAFCATEGLIAEIAASKRVQWLDKPIMEGFSLSTDL